MPGASLNGSHWALVLAAVLTLTAPDARAVFIVNGPWVRVVAGTSAEAYMELRSTEGATLVDVRTSAAAGIAIRPPGKAAAAVSELPLPAGTSVMLVPGQYRLALTRLKQPVKLGDRVPLTLTIEATDGSRQEISINAEVRRHSPLEDHRHPHTH